MKKVFEDTLELWVWLFNNSKQINSKMSDNAYSKEIDRQLDLICYNIKQGKKVFRHGFEIILDITKI